MTLSVALSIVIMFLLLILKQRDIALSNERMAKATSNIAMLNVATAQSQIEGTQRQATIARAEELATQSLYVQDKNFPLSLLLGIEAYKTFETPLPNARTGSHYSRPNLKLCLLTLECYDRYEPIN